MTQLPIYLLLQPFVAGKTVLDLGCRDGKGAGLLHQAGARRVMVWEPDQTLVRTLPYQLEILEKGPEFALPAGSVDVAICLDLLDRTTTDERTVYLRELVRLL